MAETTKKTKAPAKATKTAEKKPAAKKTTEVKETVVKAKAAEPAKIRAVTDEEVARLAHQYWEERGHKHGDHVADWLRAVQELRGKAS
jgi:hypothetical protein